MRLCPYPLRVACAVALLTSAVSGQNISAVSSSLKIRPADQVAVQSSIALHAARNEFEAFQIAILGGANGFAGVTVTTANLTLVGGTATIPASEVRAYHEATLNFSNQSSLDGAPGQWRDALVPAQDDGVAAFKDPTTQRWQLQLSTGEARTSAVGFPINVAANTNEVVWIDIHVPKGQLAGTKAR